MHAMTKENLEAAFAGESQAHMKYLIFADQAEKDGFPNIARLFRANAFAEQVHATGHFKVLKKYNYFFKVNHIISYRFCQVLRKSERKKKRLS